MERIVPLFCILMSGYWFYKGLFTYGFWVDRGPGGGFLPVVIGLVGLAISILLLRKGTNEKVSLELKAFLPVATTVLGLLFVYALGMVVAMGLFVYFWLKIFEKFTAKRAAMIGLYSMAFLYVVFKMWLQVPLPTGIIGI